MTVYRAQFEQWIPVGLEPAFQFFTDLSNLPLIMPPWLDVLIEPPKTRPAGDGSDRPPLDPGLRFADASQSFTGSCRALPFLPFRLRSQA